MFKRIGFFLLVNLAMLLMISLITHLLGVDRYLTVNGLDYNALLGFCLIWGFVGAFISLMLSKTIAKWTFKLQILDENSHQPMERDLLKMIHHLARSAGLTKMPEVGLYHSQEVNAFATGPSRSNSLVAVSTGLLNKMDHDQVEAVLGHEISHIANGDMVTMTLIQGVMNAFVMFLARAIVFGLARGGDRDRPGLSSYLMVFALEIVLGLLASIVVSYFSRLREYRADQGGAKLAGRDKMISALKALAGTEDLLEKENKSFASLKISGRGMAAIFSTHPPLEMRIKRLQRA